MNNDNMLLKIVDLYNKVVFSDKIFSRKKTPQSVVSFYENIDLDLSDNEAVVENLFGNVDICFIFGKVGYNNLYDIICLDDNRGTRIIPILFVDKLLNKINKLKATSNYPYPYKIFDTEGEFVSFAKDYHKNPNGDDTYVYVYKEEFETGGLEDGLYLRPSNKYYILALSSFFSTLIHMIRPEGIDGTSAMYLYDYASEYLALYSHQVTIGDPTKYDYKEPLVNLINKYTIQEVLDGKYMQIV